MKKHGNFSKKEALKAFFRSDIPHPEMGNLSAIFIAGGLKSNFFDPAACQNFVLRAVHKNRALCPHCREPLGDENSGKFWNNQQFYCPICKKKSHATTGTPLSGTTMTAADLVCMAVLFLLGFSDSQIAEIIGSNHHTIKRWRHLLAADVDRWNYDA